MYMYIYVYICIHIHKNAQACVLQISMWGYLFSKPSLHFGESIAMACNRRCIFVCRRYLLPVGCPLIAYASDMGQALAGRAKGVHEPKSRTQRGAWAGTPLGTGPAGSHGPRIAWARPILI